MALFSRCSSCMPNQPAARPAQLREHAAVRNALLVCTVLCCRVCGSHGARDTPSSGRGYPAPPSHASRDAPGSGRGNFAAPPRASQLSVQPRVRCRAGAVREHAVREGGLHRAGRLRGGAAAVDHDHPVLRVPQRRLPGHVLRLPRRPGLEAGSGEPLCCCCRCCFCCCCCYMHSSSLSLLPTAAAAAALLLPLWLLSS
jgi:hypothetical protein